MGWEKPSLHGCYELLIWNPAICSAFLCTYPVVLLRNHKSYLFLPFKLADNYAQLYDEELLKRLESESRSQSHGKKAKLRLDAINLKLLSSLRKPS